LSFNGSGTFNRLYNWVTDKANGIKVRADRSDAELDGIATGLSTCITKDGQTTITADIPFANHKITGLAAGTATTDAATLAQAQSQASTGATVGGTADAITLAVSPSIAAYAALQRFRFVATGTNTTAVTVAVSGLAAKAIEANNVALVAGDIVSGHTYELMYDGTAFQMFASRAAVVHTADLAADAKTGAVRAVIGTSDTILAADRGKLVTYSNASAIAVTLPQATGSFTTPFKFSYVNLGAGAVTFTPTTSTIDGAATLVVATGDGGDIFSDGTNYFSQRGTQQEAALPVGYLSGLTVSQAVDTDHDITFATGYGSETLTEDGMGHGHGFHLRQVRIVLVPATELPRLEADLFNRLAPPVRLSCVLQGLLSTVTDNPGHCYLPLPGLPSGLAVKRSSRYIDGFVGEVHLSPLKYSSSSLSMRPS